MRQAIKHIIERVWLSSGLPVVSRYRHRDGALVLAYHDIVPDGEQPIGDRSLHLPRRDFAEQLDLLAETHDVVPIAELIDAPPRRGRPLAAITFDDAYRGALTAGIGELTRRGMPATIFVPPAFVGGRDFWWDALASPGRAGLDEAVRWYALETLRGDDAEVRQWAAGRGLAPRRAPAYARCVTEEELHQAAADPAVSLASHGWSHRNLTRLDAADLRLELERPMTWLRERFMARSLLSCISYPYGRCTPAVERAAAAAGYRAAFRVEGGWLPASARPTFATPRLNIGAGLSRAGFELRLAGLLCR